MSACNLQPSHRILSLRASMSIAYKLKNFIYASFFAKKIMKLNDVLFNLFKYIKKIYLRIFPMLLSQKWFKMRKKYL